MQYNKDLDMAHNSPTVDTLNGKKTPAYVRYVNELHTLPSKLPNNGEKFRQTYYRYVTGDNRSVTLNELQLNLAMVIAAEPERKADELYYMAGYNIESYMNEADSVKRLKAHLVGSYNAKKNTKVTEYANYLKYGSGEKLLIDATYILNEQVNLYEECRREKQFTTAARLLDNLAMHVDVDAKISNRVVVEGAVDYAALLDTAAGRVLYEQPKLIETTTEEVETLVALSDAASSINKEWPKD